MLNLIKFIDYSVLRFGISGLMLTVKIKTQNRAFRILLMPVHRLLCWCAAWSLGRLLTRDLQTEVKAKVW